MSQKFSHLPVAMPGGPLAPHMSAKLRTEMVDALFVGAGGFDRALTWINKSDENYGEFFKIYARGAVRSSNVELTADDSVENLLSRLDAGENARVINGKAETVDE